MEGNTAVERAIAGGKRKLLVTMATAHMVEDAVKPSPEAVELLHPFYLDTDMSMTFSAALAGGVALEREEVERDDETSQAIRNIRGNLRLFGALGAGGSREVTESEGAATESRLVRHHTEASIFIALYDELRRSGRVADDLDLSVLRPAQIVSLELGPAVAPLRRVVDQIVRLLDVALPFVGLGADEEEAPDSMGMSRQQRRQQAREAAKKSTATGGDDEPDQAELRKIRALFVALQDDLDRSGMMDVCVEKLEGLIGRETLIEREHDARSIFPMHDHTSMPKSGRRGPTSWPLNRT